MKDCLRKRGLDDRQVRGMVDNGSEWQEFMRWNAWSITQVMNLQLWQDAIGCHGYVKPLKDENLCLFKPHLRGNFFLSFLTLFLFSTVTHFMAWSMLVVRDNQMVQGSCVGGPLPVSFFCFSFFPFSVLFFIPYELVNCQGWGNGFHPVCIDYFLFSSLFSLVFTSCLFF